MSLLRGRQCPAPIPISLATVLCSAAHVEPQLPLAFFKPFFECVQLLLIHSYHSTPTSPVVVLNENYGMANERSYAHLPNASTLSRSLSSSSGCLFPTWEWFDPEGCFASANLHWGSARVWQTAQYGNPNDNQESRPAQSFHELGADDQDPALGLVLRSWWHRTPNEVHCDWRQRKRSLPLFLFYAEVAHILCRAAVFCLCRGDLYRARCGPARHGHARQATCVTSANRLFGHSRVMWRKITRADVPAEHRLIAV